MMRIITGKAKGIRLKTLEGEATRPTAERVKEAVFSMLIDDIQDREILDLFSGSGQLGLEAISRGANHAILVDRSPHAIRIITENAQKTKLISQCDIKCDDYLSFIKKNKGNKYDLVFVDPPYASGLYAPVLNGLYEYNMLKPSTLIVCEHGDEQALDFITEKKHFCIIKKSKYGKTFITIISLNEDT